MPNLSIKNVPEVLAERLRQRAERNHRSLQGELMAIVSQAVADESGAVPAASPGLPPSVGKTIEQIAAEHRARWPQPIEAGPRAVDIVRADRDSR